MEEAESLSNSINNNNNNNNMDKAKESVSPLQAAIDKFETIWTQWMKLWREGVLQKLPAPLVNLVGTILAKLFALRWQFVSFTAGAFLTVAAILVPIYSQVETLSKPVTLFETILGDLEQAYVDPVDTDKLFETGMAAMLRYVVLFSPCKYMFACICSLEHFANRYSIIPFTSM